MILTIDGNAKLFPSPSNSLFPPLTDIPKAERDEAPTEKLFENVWYDMLFLGLFVPKSEDTAEICEGVRDWLIDTAEEMARTILPGVADDLTVDRKTMKIAVDLALITEISGIHPADAEGHRGAAEDATKSTLREAGYDVD